MANKEFRVSYDDPRIKDPQRITKAVEEHFAKLGMDIKMNDCLKIDDDDDRRERVYRVKTRTKTFY